MLQLAVIRNRTDWVKERLGIRNFRETELVEQVLEKDDLRRRLNFEYDESKARVNSLSKEIGQLMKSGNKEEAEKKKQEVEGLKNSLSPVQKQLDETEAQLHDLLLRLPNLPSENVPAGSSAADNEVVRSGGAKPVLPKDAVPHWELARKFNLIDFDLGTRITGSGFPVYRGSGARLQRALIHFFLDYNISAGYEEFMPPLMVNSGSAYGTGQLPDKEGQMYHATADDLYLIPTAEVPVTNIYRGEILQESRLPVKMTAYTPCFRREAGSYGKDVRGLNRLHQFDKVEIVQIVHPDKSYEAFEEMVLHVEKLIQALELPYRILKLCGGDMGFTSALTYDFEVFSAAQDKWLEVSSVSNFETFQANRMKIRFRDDSGKTQLVHTLNGSSLALPRILACLLENNQDGNGIRLPVALHSYFGGEMI